MNGTVTNATLCESSTWCKLPTVINMAVHIINFFVGFPLNCYVVKLLLNTGRGLDWSVVFDLSQASAEIIFTIVTPFSILCYASDKLCFLESFGFLYGGCLLARPLFQCCMCVERYLAVVHPVTFLKYKPMRYRLMCITVIWICTLVGAIVSAFYFPNMPHWVFGIVYIMVLSTDIFCCVSILKALWEPKPGDKQTEDAAMNTAKKKAFEIVVINLLTFLVQIIPSAAIFGISTLIGQFYFDVAVSTSFISNVIPGFVQPLFFLRRVGKLTFTRCA